MTVFLTGATGYIGGAVARALQQAGHSVIGLARSDEAAGRLHLKEITVHHGDLASPDSLIPAASASDAVIHAGATGNGLLDHAAVSAMLDAMAYSGKPFLYTSGVWVLGNTNGLLADETAPLNPAALVAWRPAMEQMVLAAANIGIRTIVIRPAIVYGNGDGILAEMVYSAREHGAVRYVGDGSNRWPLVHVEDLADLYVRALEAPAGTLLHAADASAHRVTEIAEAASLGAGAKGRIKSWPLDEARKTLGAYADALILDQQVSAEKAKATLGWKPRPDAILEDLRTGSYAR